MTTPVVIEHHAFCCEDPARLECSCGAVVTRRPGEPEIFLGRLVCPVWLEEELGRKSAELERLAAERDTARELARDAVQERDRALSALEEARAGVDDLRAAYSQATDHLKAAESRADALQAEVERLRAEVAYQQDRADATHHNMTLYADERNEERARADAAWRAALDAAASEARVYANCESPRSCGSKHRMTRLASTIAALPPPSATPNEET